MKIKFGSMVFCVNDDGVLAHSYPYSGTFLIDDKTKYAYFQRKFCKFVPDKNQKNPFAGESVCEGLCTFSGFCSSNADPTYCSPHLNHKRGLYGYWEEVPIRYLKSKHSTQTDLEKEIIDLIL